MIFDQMMMHMHCLRSFAILPKSERQYTTIRGALTLVEFFPLRRYPFIKIIVPDVNCSEQRVGSLVVDVNEVAVVTLEDRVGVILKVLVDFLRQLDPRKFVALVLALRKARNQQFSELVF